jgi:hypothetical protein
MLVTLVSLQAFTVRFHYSGRRFGMRSFLSLITKLSSRSPRLEHFAIIESRFDSPSKLKEGGYYGKRVRHGEWTLCDEVAFLSVLRVYMHSLVRSIEFVLTIYCLDVRTLFERLNGAIYTIRRIINESGSGAAVRGR